LAIKQLLQFLIRKEEKQNSLVYKKYIIVKYGFELSLGSVFKYSAGFAFLIQPMKVILI
jgi:hypothetical protein